MSRSHVAAAGFAVLAAVPASAHAQFTQHAAAPGARLLCGDFNGDGKGDLALTGVTGWASFPVAFSHGDGSFHDTNVVSSGHIPKLVAGGTPAATLDFDRNGHVDLVFGSGDVGFSGGDGTFRGLWSRMAAFPHFSRAPGAQMVAGDFDGDGKTDLAVTAAAGWSSVPVAFSTASGMFIVTNHGIGGGFAAMAAAPGVRAVAGHFNGDRRADLALVGGAGWKSVPIALSHGDGTFNVTNQAVSGLPELAAHAGAQIVAGDFDADGLTDLAVTGVAGWNTIPVAQSQAGGGFRFFNNTAGSFPAFAAGEGVKVVACDIDGDGRTDIAAAGGAGWNTIPVAFLRGDAQFRVTNLGLRPLPPPPPPPPAP
jgi:hypothetical protein